MEAYLPGEAQTAVIAQMTIQIISLHKWGFGLFHHKTLYQVFWKPVPKNFKCLKPNYWSDGVDTQRGSQKCALDIFKGLK